LIKNAESIYLKALKPSTALSMAKRITGIKIANEPNPMSSPQSKKAKLKQAILTGKIKDQKSALEFVIREEEKEQFKEEIKSEIISEIKLPEPIKGEPGEPGKDAEPVDEKKIVKEVLKQIPTPKIPVIDTSKITADAQKGVLGALKDKIPLIPTIQEITAQIPLESERVRDSLELLEGKNRLKREAIDGLDNYLEIVELAKKKGGDKYYGGAGIKELVAGTGITIDNTNLGYPVISAPGSTTDEKVKYDVNDPTAGYITDKFVAGTGITLTEGTGADENKLKITSSITQYTDALAVSAIKADADWNATDWDTAYGWGNHASAGYLTSLSGALLATGATTGATSQSQVFTNGVTLSNLTSGRVPYATTSGQLTDSANLTFNGTDLYVSGKIGIGASPVSYANLSTYKSAVDVGTNSWYGLYTRIDSSATVNGANYIIGLETNLYSLMDISAGVTDSGYRVGARMQAFPNSTDFEGTLSNLYGLWTRAGMNNAASGAVITNAYGNYTEIISGPVGTTITNAYGIYIGSSLGAGAITNWYDLYASDSGAKNYLAGKVALGATTYNANKMDIHSTPRSTAFDASNGATWHDVCIYNSNTTQNAAVGINFKVGTYHSNAGCGIAAVKNTGDVYNADLVFITRPTSAVAAERMRIDMNGNVGIGVTGPTAVLHLKAGTATASTAPLKFTAGTDLTTAEAGAFEYDGTNLHFTRTGTQRENVCTVVTKTNTGDGTGAEGLMQINTFDNTLKVYAEGGWRQIASW